jgi:hypothetical protein
VGLHRAAGHHETLGDLRVGQAASQQLQHLALALVGGTGAYNGARGTGLVTDASKTTSTIDITLVP